jgi:hypothetical protein
MAVAGAACLVSVAAADDGQHAATAPGHVHGDGAEHAALLGPHPANREASGTAWQPDSTPMHGLHFRSGDWTLMAHAFANAVYSDEAGARGAEESFGTGMAMLMGRRPLGRSAVGFRTMLTLEPAMGPEGYPLLLQTGETGDGINPLIDRQHPHDMLMELAVTWSRAFEDGRSVYLYVAPVGEPPVGPAAFMHRVSGADNPLAPISHHFLDSTHVTFGVATLGFATADGVRFELSAFNGHEPDQDRWGLEAPELNSFAGRISVNPSPNLALQLSAAYLDSPEQLHQGLDILRLTASLTYNRPLGAGNWQTTFAFGRNKRDDPPILISPDAPVTSDGHTHVHVRGPVAPGVEVFNGNTIAHALLAESTVSFARRHSAFARLELARKDELFPPADPRHADLYEVSRASVGYVFDLLAEGSLRLGVGAVGSVTSVPPALADEYGGTSPAAFAVIARLRLGS